MLGQSRVRDTGTFRGTDEGEDPDFSYYYVIFDMTLSPEQVYQSAN